MRKLLIFVVFIVLALVAFITIPIGIRSAKNARALQAITASGAPVCLADLQQIPPSDEKNGAWHFSQVQPEAEQFYLAVHEVLDPEVAPRINDELGEADIALVDDAYAKYQQVIVRLQQVLEAPAYYNGLQSTNSAGAQMEVITQAGSLIAMHRVLRTHARYLAITGKHDEAADWILKSLVLIRRQDKRNVMTTFLSLSGGRRHVMSLLAELVAQAELSDETHAAIDQELRQHDAMNGFTDMLLTERAFGIEIQNSFPLPLRLMGDNLGDYLSYMQQEIALGAVSKHAETGTKVAPQNGLVMALAPSIDSARNLMNVTRADIRALRILNAIRLNDVSPAEFDLATSGIAKPETIDPFSGKPMMIASMSKGFAVYSVGSDQRDDGAEFTDDQDVGFASP